MKSLLFIALVFFSKITWGQSEKLSIGDIVFDAKIDDPKFQFCYQFVFQGYELKTAQDESRKWISDHIKEKFSFKEEWKDQTGFIAVRFSVNCLGLTDRFRVIGSSEELKPFEFPLDLCKYLTQLVKDEKWPIGNYHLKTVDYYHVVTFKIVNGKLLEVLL